MGLFLLCDADPLVFPASLKTDGETITLKVFLRKKRRKVLGGFGVRAVGVSNKLLSS